MAAECGSEGNSQSYLAESLKRFCRSVELSDDYLRGYYGLKRVRTLVKYLEVKKPDLLTSHPRSLISS